MNRSPLVRKTPMRRTGPDFSPSEHPRAKEGGDKTAKERKCGAPHCSVTFAPRRMEHIVCSPKCLIAKRKADAAAKKAQEKAERESFKARKEALKTLSQLTAECREIVQAIARNRDRHDGCISCHVGPNYGGVWHGSHFRPAGMNAAVELHLWNIHKACEQCNYYKGGNVTAYRPRLVEKIGEDRVKWLESQNQTVKRTREYLARFKKVMGKRLRRMEKARG